MRVLACGLAVCVAIGVGLARYEIRNNRVIETTSVTIMLMGGPAHQYFWSPCGGGFPRVVVDGDGDICDGRQDFK